jgi:hypothetical protein
MSMVVMCCGCRAILGKNGKLVKHAGGIVQLDVPSFFANFTGGELCAEFQNVDEANAAARKAGWRVEDGNHRCPECLEIIRRHQDEVLYAAQGALLEIRGGKIIGVLP